MNLEDHVGDIVSKARDMSQVPEEAAARAAKLSAVELRELERRGEASAQPDYVALARLLGLDSAKLEAVAKGWRPAKPELSRWRELRVVSSTQGGMAVNSYLVWDEVSREAALFDTGWEAAEILHEIESNRLQLRHIFITHWHHDHIGALDSVRERFPKAHLHSGARNAPLEQRNRPNDFIHLGSLRITHRETPGHSEDGTTYIVGTWPEDAPHVAFVGDALFAGSMGRGLQAWELARQKVREQILSLPGETLLCPGHGPLTSVAEEKAHNPFF